MDIIPEILYITPETVTQYSVITVFSITYTMRHIMEFYELHPTTPQTRFINKAVEVLKNGGVIIYPTDTVYGIGCDIFNKEALERIFRIKNDSATKLFSFVCSDLKDISKYAKVSDYAYRMMKKLLPGP